MKQHSLQRSQPFISSLLFPIYATCLLPAAGPPWRSTISGETGWSRRVSHGVDVGMLSHPPYHARRPAGIAERRFSGAGRFPAEAGDILSGGSTRPLSLSNRRSMFGVLESLWIKTIFRSSPVACRKKRLFLPASCRPPGDPLRRSALDRDEFATKPRPRHHGRHDQAGAGGSTS